MWNSEQKLCDYFMGLDGQAGGVEPGGERGRLISHDWISADRISAIRRVSVQTAQRTHLSQAQHLSQA
jgi:hypothetical protein